MTEKSKTHKKKSHGKSHAHKKPAERKSADHKSAVHKTAHHAKHSKSANKQKKPVKNYALGVLVFIVLVAVVYGLITVVSNFGIQRSNNAATVNGEAITLAYLEEQYSRIPAEYQQFIDKETLLNQTINEVLLLQEAKKAGLSVSDEEVQAEINTAMAQSGITSEDLDERLAEQGINQEILRELYSKQLIINKLLEEKVFSEIYVSESEIETFYNERIHAAHILVETEDEAYDIIRQLGRVSRNSLPTKFGELATELSTDPSAATNGGDLGEFSKGQMVAPFEEAVFALEELEYTAAPVQTQFGYHVILRLPKDSTLEEESPEIREMLAMQKKSAIVPSYIEQLKSKADIKITYEGDAEE